MAYIPIGDKTPKQRKEERKKREEEKLDQAGAKMLIDAHKKTIDRRNVHGTKEESPFYHPAWETTKYDRGHRKRKKEYYSTAPSEQKKRDALRKEDKIEAEKEKTAEAFEGKFEKVLEKMKENAKRRQQGKKPKDVYKKDK